MGFDIHQSLTNRNGEISSEKGAQYREELVDLFTQSSEYQELVGEDDEFGDWPTMMMDYAMDYVGTTIPEMNAGELREVLFELIPEKVTTLPESATEIVRELQYFWKFLQREFHLQNADMLLRLLNEPNTVDILQRELADARNYGMAKTIAMTAIKDGVDLTDQDAMDKWIAAYNGKLAKRAPAPSRSPFGFGKLLGGLMPRASNRGSEIFVGDLVDEDEDEGDIDFISDMDDSGSYRSSAQSTKKRTSKTRQKMAKASRKKNRNKK